MKKIPIINLVLPIVGTSTIAVGAIIPPAVESFFPTVTEQIYDAAIQQFLNFCKVPHISNECDAIDWKPETDTLIPIRTYLIQTIDRMLGKGSTMQDYNGNIWWDIPASQGYENVAPIALQGHMDMVWDCQGEATHWNPLKHPVAQPVIDIVNGKRVIHTKDWLTSLGSDDGQGVGLLLGLTEKRDLFRHTRIRCILTVDEETSGRGADKLGLNQSGYEEHHVLDNIPYLINVDGGPIGQINISSGASQGYRYTALLQTTSIPAEGHYYYRMAVTGGKGGHSGVDIDNNCCNALGILSKAAFLLFGEPFKLKPCMTIFNSGNSESRSKIPTEAEICFITEKAPDYVFEKFENIKTWFNKEMKLYDEPNMKISLEQNEIEEKEWLAINYEKTLKIVESISNMPFGVIARDAEGKVSVSSNISPLYYFASDPAGLVFETLTRFNDVEKGMKCLDLVMQHWHIMENFVVEWGDIPTIHGVDHFPIWEESSDLTFANEFKKQFEKSGVANPYLYRCHPGLECGYFHNAYPNLNQISIGANVLNEHNIKEMLELDSYYDLVKSIINFFEEFNWPMPQ